MVLSQGFDTLSSAVGLAKNYTQWILSAYRNHIGSQVLEVGLGQGNYVHFLPAGIHYTGLDIDTKVVEHAMHHNPGRDYVLGDINDPQFSVKLDQRYDTLLCFNVLQYARDEGAALANMLSALKPGGALLLLMPAMNCLMGRMDVLAGHRYRYEPADIRRYVDQAGGTLVRMEYFNPVGAIGWWVNNHRKHNSLEDESVGRQILLFDRYVVPISRLINLLTKHFFGQSLLCVIQPR